jgi:hypothetical protein
MITKNNNTHKKSVPASKKPKYKISKERILTISNHISEDEDCFTKEEAIEVVKYFRDEFDELFQKIQMERTDLSVLFLKMSCQFLKPIKI